MKTATKLSLAAVALAIGANANAAVIGFNNDSGSNAGGVGSSVVLFLQDTTTAAYYTVDLGITIDQLKSAAQVVADGIKTPTNLASSGTFNAPTTLGSAASAGVAAWIASRGTDTLVYSIMASQWGGNAANGYTTGLGDSTLLVASSSNLATGASHVINDGIAGAASNFYDFVTGLNSNLGSTNANATNGWGAPGTAYTADQTPYAWGANQPNGGVVGSTLTLYLLATNGGIPSAAANAYVGAQVTLNANGTITVVNPAAVPIPAAAWLLGSGLLGLAGIGRRRVQVQA